MLDKNPVSSRKTLEKKNPHRVYSHLYHVPPADLRDLDTTPGPIKQGHVGPRWSSVITCTTAGPLARRRTSTSASRLCRGRRYLERGGVGEPKCLAGLPFTLKTRPTVEEHHHSTLFFPVNVVELPTLYPWPICPHSQMGLNGGVWLTWQWGVGRELGGTCKHGQED